MVAPYTTIERWLHDAEMALRATFTGSESTKLLKPEHFHSPEQHERDNLLGEIAAYRAIITGYYLGEGHSTLAFCQEALAHLSEQNLLARAEVAYAQSLAYHSFGDIVAAIQSAKEATALAQAAGDTSSTIIYMCRTTYSLLLHGKFHEVVQIAQQAALLGTTPAGLPHAMLCWAFIFHADALRQWNRLDEALDLALQGVRLSEQTETIVALYLGYTILMRIYLAQRRDGRSAPCFPKSRRGPERKPTARTGAMPISSCIGYSSGWQVESWIASSNWVQEIAQHTSVQSPCHKNIPYWHMNARKWHEHAFCWPRRSPPRLSRSWNPCRSMRRSRNDGATSSK